MTPTERRTSSALALIFSLRMLGLFLVLPVFALYADQLSGVTPTLVGVAIGVYGLTQAILQIPFGMLSDRFGRKPVIGLGLLIFAAGSAVAAVSTSIYGVIFGRALQGAGAIAGPVMALASDLTREEQRTKAMAMIGMSIGLSFAIAIIAAPTIEHWIGVPGMFWLIGALAIVGMGVLFTVVPTPAKTEPRDILPSEHDVYQNKKLRQINLGILCLHTILTANWVVVPLELNVYLPRPDHGLVYLPVVLLSIAAMIPLLTRVRKPKQQMPILLGSIALLGLAETLLIPATGINLWAIGIVLFLFFTAFNLLEALLPSLVSTHAPIEAKGAAMGMYSTSQFLGAFLGGALGGWIHEHVGIPGVFVMGSVVAGFWFLSVLKPEYSNKD
ncbi:Inner membrane transport protein YajR [Gammaproteobacteria bacterium]